MFKELKLHFTNRSRYNQWRRYKKIQKAYRKKLMKQAKEFCPWSGWYMYKMTTTMLEFYHKTYATGDLCYSEEGRIKKIANQTEKALEFAHTLDTYEDLPEEELVAIAEKEPGFKKYVEKWEKKFGTEAKLKLTYGLAYDYFEKKYTTGVYNIIGKYIWEWCD